MFLMSMGLVVNMAISGRAHFWTSRTAGRDPASPIGANNTAFSLTGTGSDGAVVNNAWRISSAGSGQLWSVAHSTGMTIVAGLKFITAPTNNAVIMSLDNGTHRVEVRSNGDLAKLKLVGSSTATTHDLDLDASEQDGVPVLLRLTLDSSGNARLYMREIIEDNAGANHFLSVTGSSSSSAGAVWGKSIGSKCYTQMMVRIPPMKWT